ncbi:hypothetical protein [Enterococcus rivorum]|uniref:Uncharacterized protein n=1 Tax=Enterococcus rivorum TaxID=762845 RepID=A0A1E5KVN5_9ENTE|nr:hypothetical protein [Enterococcus rivorum]MBP2098320.1 hypothetical protein [Enterococcus rivorum]OEH81888.1 hypothetical protein BCR26_03805 [Enterococcus rivorum]
MADIVQLEENGTVLYPKTHVSAVTGLADELKNKVDVQTTEWIDIPLINGVSGTLEGRLINGVAFLRGNGIQANRDRGTWLIMGTIPTKLRPEAGKTFYVVGAPSAGSTSYPEQNSATFQFNGNGQLFICNWTNATTSFYLTLSYPASS